MARFYTRGEYIGRLGWQLAAVFFRWSPRLCYGWRNALLRAFGGKIGRNVRIFPSCEIYFPWNLEIGEDVDIGWGVKLYNLGRIRIGNTVVISQHAHLCAGTHDYMDAGFELLKQGITIEDRVWIAADAFVGPQVTIGSNSVIAARSVVMQSTDPNSVYAGNPARKVKSIHGMLRSKTNSATDLSKSSHGTNLD